MLNFLPLVFLCNSSNVPGFSRLFAFCALSTSVVVSAEFETWYLLALAPISIVISNIFTYFPKNQCTCAYIEKSVKKKTVGAMRSCQ